MNVSVRRDALPAVIAAAGASALVITALSQHPNRAFDRLRRLDRIGFAIPNWRFFAPEPAMHDFHLLHRVLRADGTETPWAETHTVRPRRISQVAWFPDRRLDKAVFDAASELTAQLGLSDSEILDSTTYRLIRGFVRRRVEADLDDEPQGFQFLLARSTGYDTAAPPEELLTSPFIPWKEPDDR